MEIYLCCKWCWVATSNCLTLSVPECPRFTVRIANASLYSNNKLLGELGIPYLNGQFDSVCYRTIISIFRLNFDSNCYGFYVFKIKLKEFYLNTNYILHSHVMETYSSCVCVCVCVCVVCVCVRCCVHSCIQNEN